METQFEPGNLIAVVKGKKFYPICIAVITTAMASVGIMGTIEAIIKTVRGDEFSMVYVLPVFCLLTYVPLTVYLIMTIIKSKIEFYQYGLIYWGAIRRVVIPYYDIRTISEIWRFKQGFVYYIYWSGHTLKLGERWYQDDLTKRLNAVMPINRH